MVNGEVIDSSTFSSSWDILTASTRISPGANAVDAAWASFPSFFLSGVTSRRVVEPDAPGKSLRTTRTIVVVGPGCSSRTIGSFGIVLLLSTATTHFPSFETLDSCELSSIHASGCEVATIFLFL
jgi:hypothetical protein